MEQLALSSSYVTYEWKYHVFLSFRGEDTRFGFTNNLHRALKRDGIRSFIDHEELQNGEEIPSALAMTIKESRIAIVVFSKHYASSTFCLEELAMILNCIKRKGRLVWPIFYDVDPCNVQHQLESYKEAFDKHEERYGENSDKVQKWKAALSEVANIKGEPFEGENSVGNQGLVRLQQTLLFEILGRKNMEFMDVNKGCRIIKDRLQQKKVLLILDDVDERKQLQTLAGGLDWFGPGSRIIITTRDKMLLHGHHVHEERIYEVEGLEYEDALKLFTWKAFEPNEVDPFLMDISKRAVSYCQGLPLALDIMGCNLFHKKYEECKSILDTYEKILDKDIQKILQVSYNGLTEIEKVIFLDVACFFKGCKLDDIVNILENGREFDPKNGIGVLVEKSLIKIDRFQNVSMHDLIQKMGREIVRQESPLKLGERSRLWFYEDILPVIEENMGTNIIEFIMLDLPEDEEVQWDGVAFKDMKCLKILIIKNANFSEGPKYLPNSLRILDWTGYPSSSLPQDFRPRKLAILKLTNSPFDFDKSLQKFKFLSHVELRNNKFLIRIPDIFGLQNLRKLNVSNCTNLIEIHESAGLLNRLEELDAIGCWNLTNFPSVMESTYLRRLYLTDCIKLQSFPKIVGIDLSFNVISDSEFYVQPPRKLTCEMFRYGNSLSFRNHISMLPKFDILMVLVSSEVSSLRIDDCNLTDEVLVRWLSCSFPKLEVLELTNNTSIHKFLCARHPCSGNLKSLDLAGNHLTDNLSLWIPWFPNLVELNLSDNDFTILPACIKQCRHLRKLVMNNCYQLRTIIEIPSIKKLSARGCTCLTSESSSILLSQKLHEDEDTDFILPGSKIPEWFDHRCQGSSLCFWFRKNFPSIALCLVHVLPGDRIIPKLTIQVRINRCEIDFQLNVRGFFTARYVSGVEHVSLFDFDGTKRFPTSVVEEKEYIKDEWNHVEVEGTGFDMKRIGVHLFKQKNNRDNIIFDYSPTGSKKRKRIHE